MSDTETKKPKRVTPTAKIKVLEKRLDELEELVAKLSNSKITTEKKEKKEEKVKRPTTKYQLFVQEQMKTDEIKALESRQRMKAIGEKWKKEKEGSKKAKDEEEDDDE